MNQGDIPFGGALPGAGPANPKALQRSLWMKRLFIVTGIMVFLVTAASLTQAAMYRYVDENGVIRFTDNLAELERKQAAQQEAAAKKPESTEYIVGEEKPGEEKAQAEAQAATPAAKKEINPSDALGTLAQREEKANQMYQRLERRKKDMDREFTGLEMEKKRLQEKEKTLKTDMEKRDHYREVDALNKRIGEYAEKRQAFDKEIAAYNELTKHIETEAQKQKEEQEKKATEGAAPPPKELKTP
jgi:chromosome segregation ATPase